MFADERTHRRVASEELGGGRRGPRHTDQLPTPDLVQRQQRLARDRGGVVRALGTVAAVLGTEPVLDVVQHVDHDAAAEVGAARLVGGVEQGQQLDVFTVEPLPSDSPLWSIPNVIITPHSSGDTDSSNRRAVELTMENFRRFTEGEGLLNQQD